MKTIVRKLNLSKLYIKSLTVFVFLVFATLKTMAVDIYYNDFDASFGMTVYDCPGDASANEWFWADPNPDFSPQGGNCAWFNWIAEDVNNAMETPDINLTGFSGCELTFYLWMNGAFGDEVYVEISTDGGGAGGTWIELTHYTATGAQAGWELKTLNISPYDNEPSVHIRFREFQNNGNSNGIDAIKVTGGGGSPPANDECAGAISLTPQATCSYVSGNVIGATLSQAGCTGTADDDVWYSFTATATSLNIKVDGSANFDAVVQLFSGTCGSLSSLYCENSTLTGAIEMINATGLTISNTYYVRVYDWTIGTPVTTTFDICIYEPGSGCPPVSFVSTGFSGLDPPVPVTDDSPYNCDDEFYIEGTAYDSADANSGFIKPGWSVIIDATDGNSETENSIEFFKDGLSIGGWAPNPGDIGGSFYGGQVDANKIMTYYLDGGDPTAVWSFIWCDNAMTGSFNYEVYDNTDLTTTLASGTFDHGGTITCFPEVIIGTLQGISSFSGPGVYTSNSGWGHFSASAAGLGSHNITYCWNNEHGCDTCITETITVINPFDASWTLPAPMCEDDGAINLDALIIGDTSGTWSGTGVSGNTFDPTGLSGNISVTYTVGDYATTCQDISTQDITVNTLSIAPSSASASINPVCSGSPTTLNVSGGSLGTGASWVWYSGSCGGTPVGTGSPSVSPTSTTTYFVRAEGTCDTTSCVSVIVTINTLSTAPTTASSDVDDFCVGDYATIILSYSGGSMGTGAVAYWYEGSCGSGGAIATGNNQTVVAPSSTTTYYVLFEGTCNTTTCANVIVTVNPLPTAEAGPPQSIPNGTSTTLNGSASGGSGPYSYSWSPAGSINGSTDIQNPTTINLTTSTVFTLIVTDDNGCTASDDVTITVTGGPLSTNPTADPTTICSGSSSQLYAMPGGGTGTYTYEWSSNPPGFNSIVENPVVSPLVTTTYTVTVNDGSNTVISSVTVFVDPSPDANIIPPDPAEVCAGNDLLLNGNPSGGSGTYSTHSWTGDTSPLSAPNMVNPTFNSAASGTFNLTYTVTDDNGCAGTDDIAVTVLPLPVIDSENYTDISCNGLADGQIIITASFVEYSITGGPPYQSSGTFDNLPADTYNIIIQDANGCTQTGSTIIISEPDALVLDSSVVNASCGNSDGSATVLPSGGTSPYFYQWDSQANDQTAQTAVSLSAGSYYVTVTDNHSCQEIISVIVSDEGAGSASINITNVLCYGDSNGTAIVTMTGGTAPYTYQWYPAVGTDSVATGLLAGNYTVVIEDALGCSVIENIVITQPGDELSVTITDSTDASSFGESDGSATVTASGGTSPYTYLWSDENSQTTQTAANLIADVYYVTVTDANNCKGYAVVGIHQPDEEVVYEDPEIPSAFTPNSDGKNDTWEIKNIIPFSKITIEVYNRWGNLIFEYDGTGAGYENDKDKQWDGTNNGKQLPFGSYVYIVTFNDDIEPENGIVTIIR